MKKLVLSIAAAAAISAVVACGGDDEPASQTPAPSGSPTEAPSTADCSANLATSVGEIGWEDILPEGSLPAPDGWTTADAEGDAPFLAVSEGGQFVGFVELLSFPMDPPIGSFEALQAWAAEFYAGIEPDREIEYGEGYTVQARDPEPVRVGSFCGIAYGFSGTDENGEEVDRVAGIATFDADGDLFLIAARYDAVLAGEEGFADAGSLAVYEPYLVDLAEDLTFAG